MRGGGRRGGRGGTLAVAPAAVGDTEAPPGGAEGGRGGGAAARGAARGVLNQGRRWRGRAAAPRQRGASAAARRRGAAAARDAARGGGGRGSARAAAVAARFRRRRCAPRRSWRRSRSRCRYAAASRWARRWAAALLRSGRVRAGSRRPLCHWRRWWRWGCRLAYPLRARCRTARPPPLRAADGAEEALPEGEPPPPPPAPLLPHGVGVLLPEPRALSVALPHAPAPAILVGAPLSFARGVPRSRGACAAAAAAARAGATGAGAR